MPRFLAVVLLLLVLAGCGLPGREARPDTESSPEFVRILGAVAAPAAAKPDYPCTLEVRRTADGPALPQPALIAPGESHVYVARCRAMHAWVEAVAGFAGEGVSSPIQFGASASDPTQFRLGLTMPPMVPVGTDLYVMLMVDGRYSGEVHVRITAPAPPGGQSR